ncbi:MAG: ABC transporter permease [Gemmatimonadota bacterium]
MSGDSRRTGKQPGALAMASFRFLLLSFPLPFRKRFGEDMEEAFRDGYGEAEAQGALRVIAFLGKTSLNIGAAGFMERRTLAVSRGRTAPKGEEDGGPGRMGTPGRPNQHGTQLVDNLRLDLVFALRSLRRNPLFTLAALVTLALGVGATTSIFSVVNGVLLTPLPFGEPERLTMVYSTWADAPDRLGPMSKEDLKDLQDLPAFEAAVGYTTSDDVLTGRGSATLISGARVTSGILAPFGLETFMGRDLRWEESYPGNPNVVVVGHAFWTNELGGDPEILGRTLELQGETFEIVGVAPPGFEYPAGARIWRPYVLSPEDCARSCHAYRVIARMAPSVTLPGAIDQSRVLGEQLAETFPESNLEKRFSVWSLEERTVGEVRQKLWILLGAVGLVLLVACANVANLLLVRAQGRVGEVGVRAAMGANRRRLIFQVLTESLVLSGAGGAIGVGLALGGIALLKRVSAGAIPRIDEVTLDAPVLLFTLGLVVVVALLFGLSPALKLARTSPSEALGRARWPGALGRRSSRSRNTLMATEVALSVVLLVGAGLLIRTLGQLSSVELGYETENLLRFDLVLPEARYAELSEITQFYGEMENRIRALPGVASVGAAYGAPLGSWEISAGVRVEGRLDPGPGEGTESYLRAVTPTYLETARIPVLRGRGLLPSDNGQAIPVALVNETFIRENFPGQDPLGERVRISATLGFGSPTWTVVGVVPDIRSRSVTGEPVPEVYVPHGQMGPGSMTVLVRFDPGAGALFPGVREEIRAMDSALPLRNVSSMEELVAEETASTRFYLILLSVFAGIAVVLAAVGLYGVVAHLVSQRRQEIGIRLALGASGGGVVGLVLLQAAFPTLLGLGFGLATALAGGRIMESFLFEVDPRDPMVFAGVAAILIAVALVAALIPARQASRMDPVQALRAE